jgi:hypothetical protein
MPLPFRTILGTTIMIAGLAVSTGTVTLAGPNGPKSPNMSPRIGPISPHMTPSVHFPDAQRLQNWDRTEDKQSTKKKNTSKRKSSKKSVKGSGLGKKNASKHSLPAVAIENPPLPYSRPGFDSTAAGGHLKDLGEIGEAARAAKEIQQLQDWANIDVWGQKEGKGPGSGNDNGLPTVSGLPEGLPGTSEPLQTEGAPDQAALFNNQGIPRPGSSSGQTAPADGGPQQGSWAPDRTGQGDTGSGSPRNRVPDRSGWASDDDDLPDQGQAEGSSDYQFQGTKSEWRRGSPPIEVLTATYTSDDGETTIVYTSQAEYDRRGGTQVGDSVNSATRTRNRGHGISMVEHFRQDSAGRYVRIGRPEIVWVKPRRPGSQPNEAVNNQDISHLCGTIIPMYMCRSAGSTSPDEMASQPVLGDAGNGSGAAARPGRDAVTDTGDSNFQVQRGATPHSRAASGHGIGDPLGGQCPTCDRIELQQ